MDYTCNVGRMRFDKCAAKGLLYPSDEANEPYENKVYKLRPKTESPYATSDNSELDKYPSEFTARRVHSKEGSDKVGASKGFDPDVYRQAIISNRALKNDAILRAYTGAGSILSHPGACKPGAGHAALPACHTDGECDVLVCEDRQQDSRYA